MLGMWTCGMWHCVIQWVLPDVSKERSALALKKAALPDFEKSGNTRPEDLNAWNTDPWPQLCKAKVIPV